jgi:hypothetical protein
MCDALPEICFLLQPFDHNQLHHDKKNQIRCTLFYFTKFANFTLESAQEHGRQGSAASKVLRTSDADFPGNGFHPT